MKEKKKFLFETKEDRDKKITEFFLDLKKKTGYTTNKIATLLLEENIFEVKMFHKNTLTEKDIKKIIATGKKKYFGDKYVIYKKGNIVSRQKNFDGLIEFFEKLRNKKFKEDEKINIKRSIHRQRQVNKELDDYYIEIYNS